MSTAKYREKNREQIRLKSHAFKMKRDYGVSIEQYNELFTKQNGNCSICGKNQSVIDRRYCTGPSNRFEWALIKGLEYERKRENFIRLCKRCHIYYDRKTTTISGHKRVDVL